LVPTADSRPHPSGSYPDLTLPLAVIYYLSRWEDLKIDAKRHDQPSRLKSKLPSINCKVQNQECAWTRHPIHFLMFRYCLFLKEELSTSVDRKTRGSIAKDHFIFFIKDIIEAAENLNMRAQVERCGSIEESIAR